MLVSVNTLLRPLQAARQEQGDGQPAVDGEPAEQRGGLFVDVAFPGRVHGADGDRETAHRRCQYVGHRGRGQQRDHILIHERPAAS